MKRAYNFNAGPSAMPLEVLQEAQAEFLDYAGTGMSIIEMSHRSPEYDALHKETKDLLRELMEIPEDYEILFIQGLLVEAIRFYYASGFINRLSVYADRNLSLKLGRLYLLCLTIEREQGMPRNFSQLPDMLVLVLFLRQIFDLFSR